MISLGVKPLSLNIILEESLLSSSLSLDKYRLMKNILDGYKSQNSVERKILKKSDVIYATHLAHPNLLSNSAFNCYNSPDWIK